MKINIDRNMWKPNPVFGLIQKTGGISDSEMQKVFNMGIGLVFIVSKYDAFKISLYLKKLGEKHYFIGNIS
jgi:phosphoribosylformylglycinamidine cyclo-ligase